MNIQQFINGTIHLLVIRMMMLTGGVKFAIHFISVNDPPSHRPSIHAAGKQMTFGEDYYWYTDWRGHLFVLAKW